MYLSNQNQGGVAIRFKDMSKKSKRELSAKCYLSAIVILFSISVYLIKTGGIHV